MFFKRSELGVGPTISVCEKKNMNDFTQELELPRNLVGEPRHDPNVYLEARLRAHRSGQRGICEFGSVRFPVEYLAECASQTGVRRTEMDYLVQKWVHDMAPPEISEVAEGKVAETCAYCGSKDFYEKETIMGGVRMHVTCAAQHRMNETMEWVDGEREERWFQQECC